MIVSVLIKRIDDSVQTLLGIHLSGIICQIRENKILFIQVQPTL